MLTCPYRGIQKHIANNPTHSLLKFEKKLEKELDKVLYQEEVLWFQKSREEWIILGDQNMSYYNASTMVHKSLNSVTFLNNDHEEVITNSKAMKDLILGHFRELFKKVPSYMIEAAPNNCFPHMDDQVKSQIKRELMKDDILHAMFETTPLKAPGLDNLHETFYQRH